VGGEAVLFHKNVPSCPLFAPEMIQQGRQGIPQGERERGDIDGHANRSAKSVASAIQEVSK